MGEMTTNSFISLICLFEILVKWERDVFLLSTRIFCGSSEVGTNINPENLSHEPEGKDRFDDRVTNGV